MLIPIFFYLMRQVQSRCSSTPWLACPSSTPMVSSASSCFGAFISFSPSSSFSSSTAASFSRSKHYPTIICCRSSCITTSVSAWRPFLSGSYPCFTASVSGWSCCWHAKSNFSSFCTRISAIYVYYPIRY